MRIKWREENMPRNPFLCLRDDDHNHSENYILPLRFGIITGTFLGVLGNSDQNGPSPGRR